VYRGVYAVGHPGLTQHGRWLAAVKACGPGALLSRHCAGMLYEFLPLEDWRPQVMVVGGIRASAGVRVHRSRSLHTLDRWRHRGIPVTSPARTLLAHRRCGSRAFAISGSRSTAPMAAPAAHGSRAYSQRGPRPPVASWRIASSTYSTRPASHGRT
jgi:hypothetical protein